MEDIDALVRRVDEDRWLASRFAAPEVRGRLVAVYAVNYELARVAETVREPGLGDIRLQWWRDALAAPASAHEHPALVALNTAQLGDDVRAALSAIADAHGADLQTAPFPKWTDVEAYVDATAGALMRLALAVCGAGACAPFAEAGGRAWGYAGLLRAAPYWRARGRSPTPLTGSDDKGLRDRALAALHKAREQAPALPKEAFPAIGYLALARDYLDGRERPLIWRQVQLVAAAARGRF